MPRILVVDDEPDVTDALRSALELVGHEVLTAGTAAMGIAIATTGSPDVVVLDLRLPDEDGLKVIRKLRPGFEAPILILSGIKDDRVKVAALTAGADDFLGKPFGMPELNARLDALLRRSAHRRPSGQQHFGPLTIDPAAREVLVDGTPRHLTPIEWRLLDVLVSRPGEVLPSDWLVSRVWDDRYGDETVTSLRSHLRSLRAKIGDDARKPRLIATVHAVGYRWIGTETTSTAEPAAQTADGAAGAAGAGGAGGGATPGRTADALVHDLDNVLTAMRLAAYVAGRRAPHTDPDTAARDAERWDRLVQQASAITADLRRGLPASD